MGAGVVGEADAGVVLAVVNEAGLRKASEANAGPVASGKSRMPYAGLTGLAVLWKASSPSISPRSVPDNQSASWALVIKSANAVLSGNKKSQDEALSPK